MSSWNASLQSDSLKSSFQNWTLEEKRMRVALKEWHKERGERFLAYWRASEWRYSHVAMQVTALQELPESLAGAFVALSCPELLQIERHVTAMTRRGADRDSLDRVWPQLRQCFDELLESVVEGVENRADKFDEQLVYEKLSADDNDNDGDGGGGIQRPRFAAKSIAVVRSCCLLQLCTVVAYCFNDIEEQENEKE
jgi:hypothetical protein